jgi:hypothetical protein
MNRSHRGSNEPFDVTAIVWLPQGAVAQFDPIFLCSTHERVRMKLLCVVEMDFIWDATNRPVKGLEPAVGKPRILPQHALRENQSNGYYTGRFKGKIEAGYDPSRHIYCE